MGGMTEPLQRFADWRPRLTAWLKEATTAPFAYGRHDCALFAAGGVQAMTGQDFAAAYRGRYTTLAGGYRILRKDGHADHVALAAALLPAIHWSQAMPGDLAAFAPAAGPVLGIVQGAMVYVLDPAGRLALMPLSDSVGAFTV